MSAIAVVPSPAPLTPVSAPRSLADYVEAWLGELDASATTKASYRAGIKAYLSFLADTNRQGAQRADVLAYKAHLKDHYKPGTVSTRLTPVRGLYTYLAALGIGPNISAGVKGAKPQSGHRKDALTGPQVGALLQAASADKRDYALLTLMVYTGLRTIEVSRAQVGDLRSVGGKTVLDVWGKGRETKDARVIITAPVEAAIRAYLAQRGPVDETAPLFPSTSNRNSGGPMSTRSISRLVKAHLVAAGLSSSRLTAHSLRHTAVTLSLLGGASLEEAQAMARHADITTTQVYAHALDRLTGKAEQAVTDYLARAL